MQKKTVYGALLIVFLVLNLFLTLQSPDGTGGPIEGLRLWLERFGITTTFHGIRSNAHLVIFFVFGVILSLFGRDCCWSWWGIILIGCGIGLIDEIIKELLPTREFDVVDLIKDWVGIIFAFITGKLLANRKPQE